jgi:hypothetical protein
MSEAWVSVAAIAGFAVLSFGLFLLVLGSGSMLPPESRTWIQQRVFVPAHKVITVLWLGWVLFGLGEMAIDAWRKGGRSWSEDAILALAGAAILYSVYDLAKNNGNRLRAWLGRRPESSI